MKKQLKLRKNLNGVLRTKKRKRIALITIAIILTAIFTYSLGYGHGSAQKATRNAIRADQVEKQRLFEVQLKEKTLKDLQKQSKSNKDKDKEIQRLKAQLQARRQAKRLASNQTTTLTQTPVRTPQNGSVGNCGDNPYKQFIYQKESGCNTGAVNPSGCFGIGQDCNGVLRKCGTDFACQDAYFDGYAKSRYGGWEQAYNAWRSQGWW